jgi:hypothetical protein
MMKTKLFTILAVVVLCGICPVQAVLITIEITGKVTEGYGSLWGDGIHEGAVFNGTYTYDSSAPDTSDRSDIGLYVHDSPYGLNISLGGFEFETVPNHTGQFNITITDNGPNADSYSVESNQNAPLSNGATVNTFFWSLHGPDSVISSTDLPVEAPLLSQWPGNILFIYGKDVLGNGYLIEGVVTQAIPEPATSTFLLTMCIFFFSYRRQISQS